MNRSLCVASLLTAVVAVVIISMLTADVEATPRFFRVGGRQRSFGRGRVWSYRRPWNFRYFFRRNRYYGKTKPPKPTRMPTTVPTMATAGPTSAEITTMATTTTATTTVPPSTEPPTMCAPVQTCNVTDELEGLTSALYSILLRQTEGSARTNAMEVLAEFLINPAGGNCATTSLSGNVLTATFNPGPVASMELYQLELQLNEANDRVLMANFTTRNFERVGQLRVMLTFDGGADLLNANILSTVSQFRPPGESMFFPFPLRSLTCETTLVCGLNVTQPSVPPTEPEIIPLPDKLPILTAVDIAQAFDVSVAVCELDQAG